MSTSQIISSPTSPNVSFTELPILVSGSSRLSDPQFQYVLEVYFSGSLLKRYFQLPSNDGTSMFNINKLVQDNVEYDYNWNVSSSVPLINQIKEYELFVGDSFSTSPSSSITIDMNYSSSELITIFPGIVDPISPNFNYTSSKTILSDHPGYQIIGNRDNLPYINENYMEMSLQDFHTFNPLIPVSTLNIYLSYKSGNTLNTLSQTTISSSLPFNTVGIGPQNLLKLGDSNFNNELISGSYDFIDITSTSGDSVWSTVSTEWEDTNEDWGVEISVDNTETLLLRYWVTGKSNPNSNSTPFRKCNTDRVRFVFINNSGMWDYYNVYNPVRTKTKIDRQLYNQPRVQYNTSNYGRCFDIGGDKQYHLSTEDTFEVTTDYLNKEMSNFVEQLIQSPLVYLQENNNFIPIVIINSSIKINQSTLRNKQFNYTIEWMYSNQRTSKT